MRTPCGPLQLRLPRLSNKSTLARSPGARLASSRLPPRPAPVRLARVLHRFDWLWPRPRRRFAYGGDHRLAHGCPQAGHRRRLALGPALRVVVLAGGLARSLGAFVAATGQLLVSVGRAGTETGVHYRLCLRHFFPLVGRSWIKPLALRCIQFPHQLADADASPEMYLPDPALHVLVVALPGVGGQGRSI